MDTNTIVELEGVNGEWFNLSTGDRGIYLDTDVQGLMDPPVKVVMEEPGNFPGARYLNHRYLRRDLVFGVVILKDAESGPKSWLSRDSEWRKAWSFTRDCKLYITTPESGTRYLKVRLFESPEVNTVTDPRGKTLNEVKMVVVAGDPFWWEDDVVYEATTTTDTTFDPNPLPWPWPQEALPTETLHIVVGPEDGHAGLNPTDQAIYPKWGVPGSVYAPALPYVPGIEWLGAPNSPATIWTLPDYDFEEEEHANRRIRMPGLIGGLRTEEIQAIYIGGKPTSGTWTLTFDGQTTTPLAFNISPTALQAALIALSNVAFGEVSVTRAATTNETQVVTLTGAPTSGTFTLSFDGQTTAPIPFNASEGVLKNALIALSNVGDFDVSVTARSKNEVQKVTMVGEPTAGTFTLTFNGETTAPIPWDANAYTVAAALRALPSIGDGAFFGIFPSDVAVTKTPGTYQPWTVTFITNLAGMDLPQMTANPSGLSGGAGIDVIVETKTEGSRQYSVTFQGNLAGFDFPQMTGNPAGLGGGGTYGVNIATVVDGNRPYLVTFTGAKGGLNLPQMTGNGSALSGGAGPHPITVKTMREGVTAPAEDCIIDSDPRVEQVTSASGSQVWARMNGVRFRNPIPPWTESKDFEITVSGTPPGQMVTLRLPRAWSRPWGLE